MNAYSLLCVRKSTCTPLLPSVSFSSEQHCLLTKDTFPQKSPKVMSLNLEEWGNSSFLHLSVCCWMIHICCGSVLTQQQDLSREGRGCSLWPRNSDAVSCLKTDMRKWSIFPWDALLYWVTGWNCNISMRLYSCFTTLTAAAATASKVCKLQCPYPRLSGCCWILP